MNEPIVIIGAGIGGLSAAIRLAAAGQEVVVLEKNPRVGGKMYQIEADGYRWDTGPSVITMQHVFEALFAAAGRRLDEYLTLLPIDPLTRYFYANGMQLDATSDWARMAQQIEAIEPRDVEGYLAFLRHAAQLHRITGPVFIYNRPPTVRRILGVPVADWFKVDAWRTMQSKISSLVRSPELRQLLGRFATYVGGSPFEAPATLNVIAHVEMTGGVTYPQGGIYRIAAALETVAGELGVTVRTNAPVAEICTNTSNGTPHVTGVRLQDGGEIKARAVISNVDVAMTYRHLLAPNVVPARTLRRLTRGDTSCSGFILMLGVRGETPGVAHHNVWFSADYPREFQQIFREGTPPDNPTLYAAITSKTDPDHAPPGCENWFLLVNAPPLDDRFDWEAQKVAYRNRVLQCLAGHGVDLRDRIEVERIWTPRDLQERSGAFRGALYGASPNHATTALRRPHNRCRDVRGLYFAGGTTHPGGGVPMVTLSGKVASDLVLEDLARA